MVLDLVFGMGAVSIFRAESIGKLPAKGYPPKGGELNQTSDELNSIFKTRVSFCQHIQKELDGLDGILPLSPLNK